MESKYDLIKQDIANKIIHGIYPASSYLPSENELCDLYGTSRETVRKALVLLLELGYIQKLKAKDQSSSMFLDLFSQFPVSNRSKSSINHKICIQLQKYLH